MHVLLAQLPVPNNPALNVPLAAGYLKAYAHAQGLNAPNVDISIVPRQIADHAGDALLAQAIIDRQPDVLGLSLYTWNSQRSLDIARRVKAALPNVVVIGGGPEVQADNTWLLQHPGLDIGVIGEGEQTFVALLERLRETRDVAQFGDINGLAYRCAGDITLTTPRVALSDLSVVPSPYLAGYLEVAPGSMAMIEVSRWCPYACNFCLYGRNMGPKLGQRYFGLERVMQEIAWAKANGATAIHFVEANLNLVPFFRPLMQALADFNADGALAIYAELRGEHLREDVVVALKRAGLRVAEVGLQTANPAALKASQRKTDLRKWAAGTRRLLAHDVEVLLDVILGLPADDPDGVRETLAFIAQEGLGAYDIFMLQVLPGTAVRQQAATWGLAYQPQPPYYVQQTDRLSFEELRQLRRKLKLGAGLDPAAVEGHPPPRRDALSAERDASAPITRVVLTAMTALPASRLASHVDLIAQSDDLVTITPMVREAIAANPATLFDLYLHCAAAPDPEMLVAWRDDLPHQPGYLDYLTIYREVAGMPQRVSPRVWLVLPWTVQAEPRAYPAFCQIIWRYDPEPGSEPPLGAWRGAGGAGVWVPGATAAQAAQWQAQTGLLIWY